MMICPLCAVELGTGEHICDVTGEPVAREHVPGIGDIPVMEYRGEPLRAPLVGCDHYWFEYYRSPQNVAYVVSGSVSAEDLVDLRPGNWEPVQNVHDLDAKVIPLEIHFQCHNCGEQKTEVVK